MRMHRGPFSGHRILENHFGIEDVPPGEVLCPELHGANSFRRVLRHEWPLILATVMISREDRFCSWSGRLYWEMSQCTNDTPVEVTRLCEIVPESVILLAFAPF